MFWLKNTQISLVTPPKLYVCIKYVRSKCNIHLRDFIIAALVHHTLRVVKANSKILSTDNDDTTPWQTIQETKEHWQAINQLADRIDNNDNMRAKLSDRRRRLDKPFQSI